MSDELNEDLLWPRYDAPDDLAEIESVPLERRGLPKSTYALLRRAATRWPDRPALTVLPEAARWWEARGRTFAELLADVHRYANLLHLLGVRRGDAVALMSPNCAERVNAPLAAQVAGIAAPLSGTLDRPSRTPRPQEGPRPGRSATTTSRPRVRRSSGSLVGSLMAR
jgi:fatty-acyl-CoA synthase